MNRNNYISPRSYGNEATLFINPAKKNINKSKRKISRPSLILSFLIVFSFFSLILGYSAFADETSDTAWELWDDDEYIYIDGYGSIETLDLFAISLAKQKCEDLRVDFYISSFDRIQAKQGQEFILEITETPDEGDFYNEYKNEVFVNYLEKRGNHTIYILSFEDMFMTQDWIDRLHYLGPSHFYIDITQHADWPDSNPSIYFEHTANIWDLSGLKPVLLDAFRKCRFLSADIIDA